MIPTVESVLCDSRVRAECFWANVLMTPRTYTQDDGTRVNITPVGMGQLDIKILPRVEVDVITLDVRFET